MFANISNFVQDEFQGAAEDYKLIEKLNETTRSKYKDIEHIISCLNSSSAEMNNKLEHLEPLLQQIDEIDGTVNKLEASALKLDGYSQELEKKLQKMIAQQGK